MLRQRKGLPIGGHLSAVYVELVALQREFQCAWPTSLTGLPAARYRDNFFVAEPEERTAADREWTAAELSELLLMPVVFERAGRVARCLELRLDWKSDVAVKATLAYRTDADRQGESGNVRIWPEWQDPRAPALLRGLLAGLASKLLRYSDPGMGWNGSASFHPPGLEIHAAAGLTHATVVSPLCVRTVAARHPDGVLAQVDACGAAAQPRKLLGWLEPGTVSTMDELPP